MLIFSLLVALFIRERLAGEEALSGFLLARRLAWAHFLPSQVCGKAGHTLALV